MYANSKVYFSVRRDPKRAVLISGHLPSATLSSLTLILKLAGCVGIRLGDPSSTQDLSLEGVPGPGLKCRVSLLITFCLLSCMAAEVSGKCNLPVCPGPRGNGFGKQVTCLCHMATSLYGVGGPSINLGSSNPILIHHVISVSTYF